MATVGLEHWKTALLAPPPTEGTTSPKRKTSAVTGNISALLGQIWIFITFILKYDFLVKRRLFTELFTVIT